MVDFGTRPAVLSNAVVRQHRCALATTYLLPERITRYLRR